VREERLRDLGGLALEMYRRDQFREDLLLEQCAELMTLEERLHELDQLLATATAVRQTPRGARCACGAPILYGSHFCANCGRPVEGAGSAPAACPSCGGPLAADAKFCPTCGYTLAEAEQPEPEPEPPDELPEEAAAEPEAEIVAERSEG
jgi:rubrerythrin